MNKLVLMVGVPGSGKSTYARKYYKGYQLLSSDEIRKELFNDENCQSNNAYVFSTLYKRARAFLLQGLNVVIDATNVTIRDRKKALNQFEDLEIKRICCYIKTPIEICYKQDLKRERNVGKEIINSFFLKLEEPTKEEGFDQIKIVEYKKQMT